MASYTCSYCGHSGYRSTHHDEHPLPKYTGHTRIVDSCDKCNLQKGIKSTLAFARWLRDNPDEMAPGWPYSDSNRRPFVRRTLAGR